MTTLTRLLAIAGLLTLASCKTVEPEEPAQTGTLRATGVPGVFRYEVFGVEYETIASSLGYLEIGVASWYGKKFHGRRTSNGEIYDMYQITAAHKALPLPTYAQVTNLDNGRKIVVRINDRGPFHDDRLIDLSYAAAVELGFADQGIAPVVVEAIDHMNYPELVKAPEPEGPRYYLQVGAYGERRYAESAQQETLKVLGDHLGEAQVKILEAETPDRILHKVWIGPIDDEETELFVENLLISAGFVTPIRVTVD